ncbi:MAG TPA: AAA family ATPase [Spirochaetia bacterium]|nr:AAA family ATPase [Spirochaetia bacterium]
MFLKTLEILGFKSFADRVTIDFTNGVAALLGPNGCGKSNVVDAMKWVLGEQSARSIRAESMSDVIFGGSESRKPMNVCEVTLTISNEDEVLPLNLPEISIRRRLFRSGESEYFINANPAKLREVRELFFDTGIGKSAYSIMEQGRIDQLLSTRPEERRLVFEEAAGITRFRSRGLEAERKLARTEENMRHVEAILDEVRRSYTTLKGQAEKAEAYRKLREQTFEVELEIELLRLKGLLDDKKKREARLAEKEKMRNEITLTLNTGDASLAQQADLINSMESQVVESYKKLYQLETEKNTRANQIRVFCERIVELESSIEASKAQEENATRKLQSLVSDTERANGALSELVDQIGATERSISDYSRDIGGFSARVKANEGAVRDNGLAVTTLESRMDGLRAELRAITEDIVTVLDAQLKEGGYSSAERETLEASIEGALQSLRTQLAAKASTIEDAVRVDTGSRSDHERLVRDAVAALKTSLEKLTALEQLVAQYRRFVPTFLEEFLSPQGIITRKRKVDEGISDCAAAMSRLRQKSEQLTQDNDALRRKIESSRATQEDLRVSLARQQTQRTGLRDEVVRLAQDQTEQESLIKEVGAQIEQTLVKRGEMDQRIASAEQECAQFDTQEHEVRAALSGLEGKISSQSKELLNKQEDQKQKGALLSRVQSEIEKTQIEVAEIRTEIRDVRATFMERFSRDLFDYEARIPDLVPSHDLRPRLATLKEETKKLGQINLMASEEFAEVKERFDFLAGQLGDLTRAREDLTKVTNAIRTESTELFLDTYTKVKKTFHTVFRRLFGGGRADLRLEKPESPLESGIEILVQPPGKKLEDINLLSGGESSLTGVALLFAIYMVKPSPFCLLDEIDAALDEENVTRLAALLKEFSTNSQFIVISHNKRTVAGADALYGVTMEESGVSKLVAVRLENRGPDAVVPSIPGDKNDGVTKSFKEASWPG